MPLHILQLGPYPPPEGGVTHNMLAIRNEAMHRGHKCSIIATSRSSRIIDEPDVYHPRSPAKLVSLIRSLDSDVLHLHLGGDLSSRVLSLALACTVFGPRPRILTVHSGAYPLTAEAAKASPVSLRGRIFRRFSHVIGVNEALADVFRRYGVANERISVTAPYSLQEPDEGVAVPAELESFYHDHSPMILSVGGLEQDYQPLMQIEAMRSVLEQLPEAGLIIVGDGSMRGEVEAAVLQNSYADRIHLAGNIDHTIVLHLIRRADMLLRTTLFDGDAISVREALFLGTPVIATDIGQRPEGVTLIGIRDTQALATAVIQAARAGKTASRTVKADTSNIAQIVDLYEQLVGP
jgi:glycosyltransferase involved in cell wall biosynthesis